MFDWKKQFVDITLQEEIIKAVNFYGIEGAESKIKEIYCLSSTRVIRDNMLNTLYKMYNFGKGINDEDRN